MSALLCTTSVVASIHLLFWTLTTRKEEAKEPEQSLSEMIDEIHEIIDNIIIQTGELNRRLEE